MIITSFFTGLIVGVLLIIGIAYLLSGTQSIQKPQTPDQVETDIMAMCQRYFGLIATRESIQEARKIANKALKNIHEGIEK